jgi:hypothetical protein
MLFVVLGLENDGMTRGFTGIALMKKSHDAWPSVRTCFRTMFRKATLLVVLLALSSASVFAKKNDVDPTECEGKRFF